MPFYDRKCGACGFELIDTYEAIYAPERPCPRCAEPGFTRAWLTKPSNVISDECDVVVEHGICNPDGSPRRYRFKSEMRAEAKRRGLESHVTHQPEKGSDRSKHTTRWI